VGKNSKSDVKIICFIFNIISKTDSLTPVSVSYSCEAPEISTSGIAVPVNCDNKERKLFATVKPCPGAKGS
jgi:hypothetical protein